MSRHAFDKLRNALLEAQKVAQGDPGAISRTKVTPSCGCNMCDHGLQPFKLRRRWVHHIPKEGRLIVCNYRNPKPGS